MVATPKTYARRRVKAKPEENGADDAEVQEIETQSSVVVLTPPPPAPVIVAPPPATATAPSGVTPTGVRRLDELLGGGFPQGSAILGYGAPYSGKGTLQRSFFLEGPRHGHQSAFVLTDTDATEMSSRIQQSEPTILDHEKAGLARYIDAYSGSTGNPDRHAGARYIDGLENLDDLNNAISTLATEAQQSPAGQYRLAIQSVSTLLVEAGPSRVFKFLRALTGRLRRTNGTAFLLLEAGMHPESDVQAMKHLCAGMIHTREVDERYYLRIEGLRTVYQPGWIEYEFTPSDFQLTGSFASERIRSTALAA